jgi:hypothetical protein
VQLSKLTVCGASSCSTVILVLPKSSWSNHAFGQPRMPVDEGAANQAVRDDDQRALRCRPGYMILRERRKLANYSYRQKVQDDGEDIDVLTNAPFGSSGHMADVKECTSIIHQFGDMILNYN